MQVFRPIDAGNVGGTEGPGATYPQDVDINKEMPFIFLENAPKCSKWKSAL